MTAVGYTGGDPNKVDISGDTMMGPLILSGDPVIPLGAATKQFAEAQGGGGGGSGTPSNTVVAETTYSQATTAGASTNYSRGDHTHGTPALPTPGAIGAATTGHNHTGTYDPSGSAASALASALAADVPLGGSTPTAVSITAVGAAGASGSSSHQDHTHAGPGFGSVTAQTSFGAASADGTASTVAHSDHTHGTPSAPSVPSASSSVVAETSFGISSAVGVATTYSRGDHTHGTPAAPTAASVGAPALSVLTTKGDLYAATGSGAVARQAVGSNGDILRANSANSTGWETANNRQTEVFAFTGTATVQAGVLRWYNRTGRTLNIVGCWAAANTQPTGSPTILVDVNKNGTTIYTTQGNRPTVAASTNGGVMTTPDVTTIADGDYITVDVDSIGATIAGADVTIGVVYW